MLPKEHRISEKLRSNRKFSQIGTNKFRKPNRNTVFDKPKESQKKNSMDDSFS